MLVFCGAAALYVHSGRATVATPFIGISDGPGRVYRFDSDGTGVTLVRDHNLGGVQSLARDSSGVLWTANTHDLIRIDPITGLSQRGPELNLPGVLPINLEPRAMAFGPNGGLFLVQLDGYYNADVLYRVDTLTGQGTPIGSTGRRGIVGLAFSPSGALYGWDDGYSSFPGIGLITIDLTTAQITDINPVNPIYPGPPLIQTLSFSPDGRLFGGESSLYEIDPNRGTVTYVRDGLPFLRGIEVIPEPAVSWITLLGVAFLMVARCLKRAGRQAP